MKKALLILLSLLLIGVIIGEFVGRWYGLTNFPIFISNNKFEYISKPNQMVRIYRNRFVTNSYSMRSDPIEKTDTTIVLIFGDSVLFGGNQIDQDSLATMLLEKRLSQAFNRRIRVLNISSKSWGPDNAAAYVRQYGTFNADMIVLVFNSGDAHDNMSFKPIVGIDFSHPDKNATFAWEKIGALLKREVSERFTEKSAKELNEELLIAEDSKFNPGFSYFDSLTKAQHIPFIIYLHKTIDEIQTRKREKGGDEIAIFCRTHNVLLVQSDEQPHMYLDGIHFNCIGQRFLANELFPVIQKKLIPIVTIEKKIHIGKI